jgi:sphinganine-1-phosphate aldolase
MSNDYPYAERYGVNRALPAAGRSREEVLAELEAMAKEEDAYWETGRCSGTMYCGDHDHYAFMNDAFGLFAHVNALQRDMCPSATRFEGEIIAMALDLFHGDAAAGPVTSPPAWSRPAARAASCTPCSPTASSPPRSAVSPAPT